MCNRLTQQSETLGVAIEDRTEAEIGSRNTQRVGAHSELVLHIRQDARSIIGGVGSSSAIQVAFNCRLQAGMLSTESSSGAAERDDNGRETLCSRRACCAGNFVITPKLTGLAASSSSSSVKPPGSYSTRQLDTNGSVTGTNSRANYAASYAPCLPR